MMSRKPWMQSLPDESGSLLICFECGNTWTVTKAKAEPEDSLWWTCPKGCNDDWKQRRPKDPVRKPSAPTPSAPTPEEGRDMTAFQEQVAEALQPEFSRLLVPIVIAATKIGAAREASAIEPYKTEMGDACDALLDMLQVRIAAAIRAAEPTGTPPERLQSADEAALAALRGQHDPIAPRATPRSTGQ